MKIIGIDPGLRGGIATLADNGVCAWRMPLDADKRIDVKDIYKYVETCKPNVCYIEEAHSWGTDSKQAVFTNGRGYGQIEAVFKALSIELVYVRSKDWQKAILGHTTSDKKEAMDHCGKRFPYVGLVPDRCRVPHDGISDALCIAEYGWLHYYGSPWGGLNGEAGY